MKADKGKQLDEVLKILEEGKDPVEYLESLGYKVPTQAWADLKIWARKHRPDDRKKMPDNLKLYYADHGIQRPGTAPAVKKPVENPVKPDTAVETVNFDGKEYEKYEQPTEIVQVKGKDGRIENVKLYGDKPSPTCCQPARPSGVTVPDQLPDEKPKKQLPVYAVKSNVYKTARYENSTVSPQSYKCMSFIWRDDIVKDQRELTLSVETWRKLIDEIPQALAQLGL